MANLCYAFLIVTTVTMALYDATINENYSWQLIDNYRRITHQPMVVIVLVLTVTNVTTTAYD
jgi:hypothetical protein